MVMPMMRQPVPQPGLAPPAGPPPLPIGGAAPGPMPAPSGPMPGAPGPGMAPGGPMMGGPQMGGPQMGPMPPAGPPQGGPPSPMGMPPAQMQQPQAPMDPRAGLVQALMSNPDLLEQLLGPIQLPLYREGWQMPVMPTVGQMLDKISDDEVHIAALRRRFNKDQKIIEGQDRGVFPEFDEDTEIPWHDPSIANDDIMLQSIIGSIPVVYDSPRLRPADDDESQAKEDFLWYLHEEKARQHHRAWATDLNYEMVKTITRYGRIVTCNTCYDQAPPHHGPFRMRLIDPSFVWPTFLGERGLIKVTLSYMMSVGDLIGWLDDPNGSIAGKLNNLRKPESEQGYKLTDYINVGEYHDTRYTAIFAGGELVLGPLEHNYGEPPFVYTVAPIGKLSYTRSPEGESMVRQGGYQITPMEADWVRSGLSFHAARFVPHLQNEAIMSKMATMVSMWGDEPVDIEQDDTVYNKSEPDYRRARGARNKIRADHERVVRGEVADMPPAVQALLQTGLSGEQRGSLTPVDYGMNPAAQTSGYSIAGLSEQGRKRYGSVVRTMEMHLTACGEQLLRFYRDFGHRLGYEGSRGMMAVPKQLPGNSPNEERFWTVTPMMIDRAGWYVKANLIEVPDTSTLAALAQTLGLIQKQGAVDKETMIKIYGLPGSRNPKQMIRMAEIDQLKDMPQWKLKDLLNYCKTELGDPQLADFILSLTMQMQMGGGPQPNVEPTGPASGQGSGGPPQGAMPQPNGMSRPVLGQQAGREGGRPAGPNRAQIAPPGPNHPMGPPTEP